MRSRSRLVGREVVTRNGRRDLAGLATGLEALRAASCRDNIVRSRHGWLQRTSRHGRMASQRSKNGAEQA